VAAIKIYL